MHSSHAVFWGLLVAIGAGCDSDPDPADCPVAAVDAGVDLGVTNDLGASNDLGVTNDLGVSDGAADDRPPAEVDVRGGLITSSADTHVTRTARRPFAEAMLSSLQMPAGFRVNVFAQGLTEPRVLVAAPGGGVYVSEREAGRVTLLRDADGDGRAEVQRAVATGIGRQRQGVHGLAVRGNELFLATDRSIYVAAIQADGSLGTPELRADDLPGAGQHPNRTLGVGPDGAVLLSLGSPCNDCPPAPEEATLVTLSADGRTRTPFATGLRNTIGFAWHPVTGQLWGFDHGSDGRGDETPPEELNRLVAGRNYGWPWCYGDRVVDLGTSQDPPEVSRLAFCAATEGTTQTYRAHAAPMQMAYYTGSQFPPEYRNDAFVTFHGSWNRLAPAGYEVARVRHDASGAPTAIVPFLSGWLIEGGRAHFGRPVGLLVATDGSLLVGDDGNGVIYRVSYGGGG